jgi:biopolymer transport protein TolQ
LNTDMSITALVLQASLVVQLVMAGLMITSLASWTVIFSKLIGLKRVRSRNDEFEREFWSGRSLTEMNEAVARKPSSASLPAACANS